MPEMNHAGIGAPVKRLEDARLLTGRGRFTDNIADREALHVLFLRSPHAHARIVRIDAGAARSAAGVVAVFTGGDVDVEHLPALRTIDGADGQPSREPRRRLIATDRVRHVGEIMAMVVAQSLDQARDAAELVEVDYETLPAVVAGDDALKPGAPLLHDDAPGNLMCDWRRGDKAVVDVAFGRAARVVSLSQRFNRIVASYLEPRAITASHDAASDVTTMTLASQGSHIPHRLLCDRVLKLPREKIRVVTADVGGGFGPKFNLYPETALMPWAARRLDRTLRWTCERSESFLMDAHARDLVARMELALDEDGRFLALRVDAVANFGAYVSMFAPTIPTTGMAKVLSGLYRIPAMQLDMRCAFTNTVPVDAFRGAGKPETLALLERLIDIAGNETGLGPVEIRRRNLVDSFPYTTALGFTYESGDYRRLLDEALKLADAAGFEARRVASEAAGRRRGLGIACHLHGSGGVADEASVVSVRADGTVEALAGTQSQGQGHETTFAQIVGGALEIPYDRVRLAQGDTRRIPQGGGTGGSSSTIISGTTLRRAADAVIRQGRDLAAEFLEAAPADIAYADGRFEVVGTDRRLGLFEVAQRAEASGRKLEASGDFVDKIESWSTGVMVCEVEVDSDTGSVQVDRFTAVADVGTVVNPLILAGQIHGGIAPGIGQALLEDAVYDRGSGQLLAGSWTDYCMPRADDLPALRVATFNTPSTNNALGIKGVGELPTNGAPAAVANALVDALRPLGVRHIESPATALRVWRAIQDAIAAKNASI